MYLVECRTSHAVKSQDEESHEAELIFVKNITNYICGEKIVMWRNFGKSWETLRNFGKFWEILRSFGRFCHNLRTFMWGKIEPKCAFVEKK